MNSINCSETPNTTMKARFVKDDSGIMAEEYGIYSFNSEVDSDEER